MPSLSLCLPLANWIDAFRLSNLPGQAIVLILLFGSIFAWTLMTTKIGELFHLRTVSRRFLRAYRKESHPIALHLRGPKFEPSPLFRVYDTTCRALADEVAARGGELQDLLPHGTAPAARKLTEMQMTSVRNIAESFMEDQALLLERSMHLLALCVSAAPLLGLLGTVWGLLDSFGDLVGAGSAMLSTVAPGISGALLTTVVGLLVAIPSAVAYNLITDMIRRAAVQMDNYLQQLMADVERYCVLEG